MTDTDLTKTFSRDKYAQAQKPRSLIFWSSDANGSWSLTTAPIRSRGRARCQVALEPELRRHSHRPWIDSWSWIDLSGKTPLFASLFGGVFIEDQRGCWLLDAVSGSLTPFWDSRGELRAALLTEGGRQRYLLAELATAARKRGLILGRDDVYDFRTPPVLGGELEPDNPAVMDFAVAINIAGQIHGQVRDLPAGTPVGEIKLEAP